MAQDVIDLGDVEKLMVGLSWDPNEQRHGTLGGIRPHNLDLSCAVLDKDLQVIDRVSATDPKREQYKMQIFHKGDNQSGGADFEDEEILVTFANLDADIAHLAFIVSSVDGVAFSDVKNGACAFLDYVSLTPLLELDFSAVKTAHVLTGLVRRDDQGRWWLSAVQADLPSCDALGIESVVGGCL